MTLKAYLTRSVCTEFHRMNWSEGWVIEAFMATWATHRKEQVRERREESTRRMKILDGRKASAQVMCLRDKPRQNMVARAFNSSITEAETGGSLGIQGPAWGTR